MLISGFSIVKNVLSQGYPFIESIVSALPVCDEFIVSDGFSNDGTYEVLQRLARSNNKIKLVRCNWPSKVAGTVLADVTNEVRRKCVGDYIFYLQANEVLHENSVDTLRALPEMFPDVQAFSLPFVHLLRCQKWSEGFRLRLAKNLPEIEAVSDAWSLGYTHKTLKKKALDSLLCPRRLYSYLGRGIDYTFANHCDGQFSKAVYLPKPVFRYWSIFARDHLTKCQYHAELFGLPHFEELAKKMWGYVNSSEYWCIVAEGARAESTGVKYPVGLASVEPKEHPFLIQRLLTNSYLKCYKESLEGSMFE